MKVKIYVSEVRCFKFGLPFYSGIFLLKPFLMI